MENIVLGACIGLGNTTPYEICRLLEEEKLKFHLLHTGTTEKLPKVVILTSTFDLWRNLHLLAKKVVFVLDNPCNLTTIKGIYTADYTQLQSHTFNLFKMTSQKLQDLIKEIKEYPKFFATEIDKEQEKFIPTMLDTYGKTSLEHIRSFIYTIKDVDQRGEGQLLLFKWMLVDKPISVLPKKFDNLGILYNKQIFQDLSEHFKTLEGKNVIAVWRSMVKTKNELKKPLNYKDLVKKFDIPLYDLKYLNSQYDKWLKLQDFKPIEMINNPSIKKVVSSNETSTG